jgi:zinc/manganese transport system substrate-binding protein
MSKINITPFLSLLVFLGFSMATHAEVKVFACEPEWAALASELGGEQVSVFSATTGLQDPHQIQARPSLIAQLRSADLLVCTGAELETGWLPLLLQRAANQNVQAGKPGHFMATEFVRLLGIPKKIDRSQGDVHAAGNPHIQTSPANILLVAKAMAARLQTIDPDHTALYTQRFNNFTERWQAAMTKWKALTRELRDMPIAVQHNSWVYLEDWLKLNNLATLEDKPGIPPSSGHLSQVLEKMQNQPAKMLLLASYQSDKAAQWFAQKTNIPVVTLPFTVGGSEQATDLFSLYDTTFTLMLEAYKP